MRRRPTPPPVAAEAAVQATADAVAVVHALAAWAEAAPYPAVREARLDCAEVLTRRLQAHTEVEATILVAAQAGHPCVWRGSDDAPPHGIPRPLRLVDGGAA
jgi:hypothetical protein